MGEPTVEQRPHWCDRHHRKRGPLLVAAQHAHFQATRKTSHKCSPKRPTFVGKHKETHEMRQANDIASLPQRIDARSSQLRAQLDNTLRISLQRRGTSEEKILCLSEASRSETNASFQESHSSRHSNQPASVTHLSKVGSRERGIDALTLLLQPIKKPDVVFTHLVTYCSDKRHTVSVYLPESAGPKENTVPTAGSKMRVVSGLIRARSRRTGSNPRSVKGPSGIAHRTTGEQGVRRCWPFTTCALVFVPTKSIISRY